IASETASPATDGNGNYTAIFGSLTPGQYEFQASFAGDTNDLSATSTCGSEPLGVDQAAPSLSTSLSLSTARVGRVVTDTATLAGATSNATGRISISVFSGKTASACSGTAVATQTTSPVTDGNGSYSASFGSLAPGDYELQANYAGDSNNQSAESTCGSEPLSIVRWAPTISTLLSQSSIAVGSAVTDTATLAGATSAASGTITISVFAGSSASACSGTAIANAVASPVTDGDGNYSASFPALNAGSYEFEASYGGDVDNRPADSLCGSEPLTVTPDGPALTTKLSSATAAVSGSVTDTATLSGATSTASGAITISLFSGSTASACVGTPISTETASPTTDGNGDYTATFSSLAAGSYELQASYAGDTNNLAEVSACGTEPLTVSSPVGGQLAASTGTPVTGADLFGPGIAAALALLIGALLLAVGTRVLRLRSR
ncbi:MAG: Ig-like domain repeat protein, partial [Candidatus Dormiibacterota bacterium]